ncbi:MAG TPA: peptidylprolyl isomerase [Burkholderiales bacterium]|jgi:peptidyl-prolyl cis-trans isomerase C|nr:peptidylprolyl isomerase [Burkholderiales bacterium]
MQSVKSAILLACITGAALLSAAGHAEDKQKNAAIVNGVPIPEARVEFVAKGQIAQSQGQQEDTPEFRDNVREILITREVLYQEAIKRKLDKNPDYVTQLDLAKQQIILGLLIDDLGRTLKPSDADLRKEYDRVKAQTGGDAGKQYKARHILVKDEAEAKQVIADLAKGGDFAKLAQEKTQDPGSKDTGGELEWSEAEVYVEPFANALKSLKKGETTPEPVQTPYGYHVIRLDDVRTKAFPEFDAVKNQIAQSLAGKVRDDYIADLRAKAKITKVDAKESTETKK